MRKRIFKPIAVGAATALISLTSLLSYVIGLIRDRIIAVNFGTTAATDTYNASFLIPDMLFNLFIAGALSAAFLPVFSRYLIKDKKEAHQLANTMLTTASILIALLATIAFIFMDQIITFSFAEYSIGEQKDIINMTRLLLPSAILFAISNTLGNILMSYKHFVAYAISPILYNLGIILGVVFLNKQFGIYSAAIGVLVGATFHCLIRVIDVSITDYKYHPELKVKHPGFKKILKLMAPKSLSLIAWQINLIIFAKVGRQLVEGGFAGFNFARNIQSFAVSLFGIAFATAIFPSLSNAASRQDYQKYTDHIQKTAQRILFFTIPAMVGIMLLAEPIIDIILGGGAFDEESIKLTSLILFFFALSIPFEGLVHILARAFYALHNTMTPMIINIIAMTTIALTTIFIAPNYGIKWFSIGFSGGLTLQVLLLAFFLRKHLKGFSIKDFSSSLTKTLAASLAMGIIVYLAQPLEGLMNPKIANVLRIILGGSAFFITAAIIKSPELSSVKYIINRVLKKKTYDKAQ